MKCFSKNRTRVKNSSAIDTGASENGSSKSFLAKVVICNIILLCCFIMQACVVEKRIIADDIYQADHINIKCDSVKVVFVRDVTHLFPAFKSVRLHYIEQQVLE